jgi:hypothetical protein
MKVLKYYSDSSTSQLVGCYEKDGGTPALGLIIVPITYGTETPLTTSSQYEDTASTDTGGDCLDAFIISPTTMYIMRTTGSSMH